mmetsp:Transcript_9827/g.31150  ORF Transcript_9827/g.31150 Transcript_9827/m.31150 type:complete len:263 (+) Transcript_9827:94-882(+)
MSDLLPLDPAIRDFVLVPISVIMAITSILRGNLTKYFTTPPPPPAPPATIAAPTLVAALASQLRRNAAVLDGPSFESRRKKLVGSGGLVGEARAQLAAEKAENPMAGNPALDPANSSAMMKKQMTTILPQIGLMSFVNFAFSGFILMSLPFPLSHSFKSMMQQGVALPALSSSYVSSISWYFLNVFGLRGLLFLLVGDAAADDAKALGAQMGQGGGAGPGAPGQPVDMDKVLESEEDALVLIQHSCVCDGVEERLLQRWTSA